MIDFYIQKLPTDSPLKNENIVWHSLRSSMMTILFAMGKELFEIKILALHKVLESTLGYQSKAFKRAQLNTILEIFQTVDIKTNHC